MTRPDQNLFQRWGHSFEEGQTGVVVYRPADYDFPRARGRDAIEFRPDGTFVDWAVGRGDANEPRPGSWQLDDEGLLRITTGSGEGRTLQVLHVDADRLELREQRDKGQQT